MNFWRNRKLNPQKNFNLSPNPSPVREGNVNAKLLSLKPYLQVFYAMGGDEVFRIRSAQILLTP